MERDIYPLNSRLVLPFYSQNNSTHLQISSAHHDQIPTSNTHVLARPRARNNVCIYRGWTSDDGNLHFFLEEYVLFSAPLPFSPLPVPHIPDKADRNKSLNAKISRKILIVVKHFIVVQRLRQILDFLVVRRRYLVGGANVLRRRCWIDMYFLVIELE